MNSKTILTMLLAFSFGISNAQDEKKEFKPGGKIFGEIFGDYYYKINSTSVDSLLDGTGEYKKKAKDDNAFSLRRLYLGYEYNFSEKFSAKLMFEGDDANLITGNKRGVNVKYYYLQWKDILPQANLVIGAQGTPTWSGFTEKIWNYRSVEKTIMDFRKLGISNDFGVSLNGKIAGEIVGYSFMVGNGTAQKTEDNRNKKIYGAVNSRLLNKKLLIEIYFDNEKDNNDNALTTIKGFIGFQTDGFTAGVEPFQKTYYTGNNKTSAVGTTVFARGSIIEDKLNAFARFDVYDGDTGDKDLEDIDNTYGENFIVAGLDYSPLKNISIIPNIWINSYNKKKASLFSDKDSDITTRITFSYKF